MENVKLWYLVLGGVAIFDIAFILGAWWGNREKEKPYSPISSETDAEWMARMIRESKTGTALNIIEMANTKRKDMPPSYKAIARKFLKGEL